jgi:hypothetical protein
MTPEDARQVIVLALAEAEAWFRLQKESDLPDLDPEDSSWTELNNAFPGNAEDSGKGPTELDRLFELAYRHEMARSWAAATRHCYYGERWGHRLIHVSDSELTQALNDAGWSEALSKEL